MAKSRKYKSGQAVFQLGQAALNLFQVISGEVQLYRYNIDGKRILLHRAYAGNFFAEASLNADNYHCTAVCMKDTELNIFDSKKINSLLNNNAEFSSAWISYLSTELRRQRASIERLNLKSAAARVRHLLMTEGEPSGQLHLQGTLSELAEILGLTRETLYRTLSKMKKAGELQQSENLLYLMQSDAET